MTILHNEQLNNTLVIDINESGKFITIIDDTNYRTETFTHDENNYYFYSDFYQTVLEIINQYNIFSVKVGVSDESREILNKLIDHFRHDEIVIFDNQILLTHSSKEKTIEDKRDLDMYLRMYMKANDALYKVDIDEDTFIKIIENVSNIGKDDFYGRLTNTHINEAFAILKSYNHLSNVITVDLEKLVWKYNKRDNYESGFGKSNVLIESFPYSLDDLL